MNGDLVARLDAKCIHTGSTKKRAGVGTVISSLIMVAAVAILGSVVLIWANSSLHVEKTKISDDFAESSNLLRETFIVEDIWLSKTPADYVNITLRNIGDIAINATAVNVTAIKSDGTLACTGSPPCTNSTNLNDAILQSKETRMIPIKVDWDNANAQTLDITITTSRGQVEKVLWRVR
jgi:hypothetical protein